ncbi:MAG: hypothetical protein AAGK22_19405 [Acidobacteriota bacterium]
MAPKSDPSSSDRRRVDGASLPLETEARGPSPRVLLWISILTALTFTRAFAFIFLPELKMFGGDVSDVWLGPWVVDSLLGALIPLAIFSVLRRRGAKTWGGLLIYHGLGAFDYGNGLLTQWLHPLPASVAPSGLVFGSLIFTMVIQTAVVVLLFRRAARSHFLQDARQRPTRSASRRSAG